MLNQLVFPPLYLLLHPYPAFESIENILYRKWLFGFITFQYPTPLVELDPRRVSVSLYMRLCTSSNRNTRILFMLQIGILWMKDPGFRALVRSPR